MKNFKCVLFAVFVFAYLASNVKLVWCEKRSLDRNRYPFVVSVKYYGMVGGKYLLISSKVSIDLVDNANFPICVGTLINPRVVVTAAYCLGKNSGLLLKQLVVTAGSEYLSPTYNSTVERRRILRKVSHPKYEEAHDFNNIAILLLWEQFDVKSNPNIEPIRFTGVTFQDGAVCTLIGWGAKENFDASKSNIPLIATKVHLYSPKFCAFMFEVEIGPGQGCTERPLLSTENCGMDVGSPLVCSNTLVGIASNFINCTDIREPNIFTLVTKYKRFIRYASEPLTLSNARVLKWKMFVVGSLLNYLAMFVVM